MIVWRTGAKEYLSLEIMFSGWVSGIYIELMDKRRSLFPSAKGFDKRTWIGQHIDPQLASKHLGLPRQIGSARFNRGFGLQRGSLLQHQHRQSPESYKEIEESHRRHLGKACCCGWAWIVLKNGDHKSSMPKWGDSGANDENVEWHHKLECGKTHTGRRFKFNVKPAMWDRRPAAMWQGGLSVEPFNPQQKSFEHETTGALAVAVAGFIIIILSLSQVTTGPRNQ